MFQERKRRKALVELSTHLISIYNYHYVLRIQGEEMGEIRQLRAFKDNPKKADLDLIQAICKHMVQLLVNQKNLEIKHNPEILQKNLLQVPENILDENTMQIIQQCRSHHDVTFNGRVVSLMQLSATQFPTGKERSDSFCVIAGARNSLEALTNTFKGAGHSKINVGHTNHSSLTLPQPNSPATGISMKMAVVEELNQSNAIYNDGHEPKDNRAIILIDLTDEANFLAASIANLQLIELSYRFSKVIFVGTHIEDRVQVEEKMKLLENHIQESAYNEAYTFSFIKASNLTNPGQVVKIVDALRESYQQQQELAVNAEVKQFHK